MLRRTYRLQKEQDIKAVLRSGRTIRTARVRVHVLPTTRPQSRVACVVGARVSRSAVTRHRYQRWLRHIARSFIQSGRLRSSYDMVWYALPSLVQCLKYQELEQELMLELDRKKL